MTRNPDRPLTDAQERALIRLADLSEPNETRDRARTAIGLPTAWFPTSRICRGSATAFVLERLGLAELRLRDQGAAYFGARLSGSMYEAKLTDAGRALLRGMGD